VHEAGASEGIVVKTETVRVERVVGRIARELMLSWCRDAPEGAREVAGATLDVLDPVWDVFDALAVASATVSIWAYCVASGGLVRAVSWTEELRVVVEEATLRSGMSIEARFSMGLQQAWIDEDKVRVLATARIDGLVLETVVLQVVTGINPLVDQAARRPSRGGLRRLLQRICSHARFGTSGTRSAR
jgi:hypothetical protein